MKSLSCNSVRKTHFIGIVVLVFFISLVLSACSPAATPTAAPTEAAAEAATEAAVKTELITVKVGASPVPHSDILRYIKENLAEKAGINLEIVEFTDYVQPNLALADGQLDANYFQHQPYLDDFNKEHKLNLITVAPVHIEPLGIYSRKIKALSELKDGDTVTIPNDATNGGRALKLLQASGLITLKDGVGFDAVVADITSNTKNLKIVELEAAQLLRSLDDTTIAVINGNYALQGDLVPSKDSLALESGENNPYVNVLVVNQGHENDEGIKILIKLITSDDVKKYIDDTYQGSVLPIK